MFDQPEAEAQQPSPTKNFVGNHTDFTPWTKDGLTRLIVQGSFTFFLAEDTSSKQMQSIAPAYSLISLDANITLCHDLIAVQPLQKAPQLKA